MRRWSKFIAATLTIMALCFASYGYGKSQVKIVPIDIGVRVLDGNGQPIRPPTGVKLQLFKFGGSTWPNEYWSDIVGYPDEQGYLVVRAKFPLDRDFIKKLEAMSR